MSAGFKITKDLLAHPRYNDAGFMYGNGNAADMPVKFRLYDDDRILYYEGEATGHVGAELAHDWAMGHAGCTMSEINAGDGWGPFIG